MQSLKSKVRKNGFALFMVLILLLNASVLVFTYTHKVPSILGPYPMQVVQLHDEAVQVGGKDEPKAFTVYPVLRVSDNTWGDVPVDAEKCSKEAVFVRGNSEWISMQPPGSLFPVSDGVAPRAAGCQKTSYRNPVPESVKSRVKELYKQGTDTSIWRITGTETPELSDGSSGASASWATEPFAIVYSP